MANGASSLESVQVQRPAGLLRAEMWISWVLRVGVLLCALILALGLGLQFFFSGSGQSEVFQQLLQGKEITGYPVIASLDSLRKGILELNSESLISLGLLLLIALPIVRVAMTVILFIMERDLVYFWITSTVLGLLLFGIVFGKAL